MELVRITDAGSQQFTDCMTVLRESIAGEVQLPEKRLLELLRTGDYQLFVLARAGEILGAALIYLAPKLHFAWLDYMAIAPHQRGQGLGSSLFRGIVDIALQNHAEWLLLEVDDDHARDHAIQRKRIEFYRRLGARLLLNVPYLFPSAFGEPVPMRLMTCPLTQRTELPAEYLDRVVTEVFAKIHRRPGNDPLLLQFRRALPQRIEMK